MGFNCVNLYSFWPQGGAPCSVPETVENRKAKYCNEISNSVSTTETNLVGFILFLSSAV